MNKLKCTEPFVTETGEGIKDLVIAYHTFGVLNESADNAIWVCHAFTANSDVNEWWPGMVGEGLMLDTSRYYIVCANMPGSCYGSTGPADVNPVTGRPWLKSFPLLTVRDIVKAHEILRKHLGIREIHTAIGASIGGYQAIEYAIMHPETVRRLVFIASGARQTPWAISFNESQRLALEGDCTF